MAADISNDEKTQIQQTIEMFEVITEAHPEDYSSLALLKEAYQKLDQKEDLMRIGRKLGIAYTQAGQVPAAIREYEELLQREPDQPELHEILDDLVSRLKTASKEGRYKATGSDGTVIEIPWGDFADLGPSLILTDQTRTVDSPRKRISLKGEDGNHEFGRFLINNNLGAKDVVEAAISKVRQANANTDGQTIALSLLDEILKEKTPDEASALLSSILDRTRFAYVPLEYYEVDRQIVRMLPEELTLGRLIVPFDLVSRTILVAICNPFDAVAKETAQQNLDYDIQWYLTTPAAISKVLNDAYRLSAKG